MARSTIKRRGLAAFAIAAVSAGVLVPAAQASFLDGPSAGRYVRGVGAESTDGFFLGAYEPQADTDGYPEWCVNMWRANPDAETPMVSLVTLTDAPQWGPSDLDVNTAQFAYLLNKYQMDKTPNIRAALSFLAHVNFEQTDYNDPQASVNQMVSAVQSQLPDVYAQAQAFAAEARASAANNYTKGRLIVYPSKRTGSIQDIGVQTASGGWAAGIPVTITLSGPAVFDNGTQTWNGATMSAGPIGVNWRSTGNGKVNFKVKYSGFPRRTMTKVDNDGSVQAMLTFGGRNPAPDPAVVEETGPTWDVLYDFQPVGTSNVGKARIVSEGATLSDTFTAKADTSYGDGKWPEVAGAPVPVTYRATAYATGDTPPDAPGAVPANAQALGSVDVTFNGPETKTATLEGVAAPAGFVTWVWTVDKASQKDFQAGGQTYKASDLVHANWSDSYGADKEITSVPHNVTVDSDLSIRNTKSGTYLVDDLWVSGLPADHPNYAGTRGFGADARTFTQTLYYFKAGVEPSNEGLKDAETIAQVTFPATNGFHPSVGANEFKVKDGEYGTYVFVTSYSGSDRVAAFTTSAADRTEQYRRGVPKIGTKAADKADGDKILATSGKVTITDTVSYENLTEGSEYEMVATLMDRATGKAIMAGGKPVTVTKTFTAPASSGTVDMDFTVEASVLAGKTTVVFESVKRDGKDLAVHADIKDKGQTVYTPKIGTTATDKADGDKFLAPTGDVTITDAVAYSSLQPGKTYQVTGTLMDKATGKAFELDGKPVTQTATFTPESDNGEVSIDFTVPASLLEGKTAVAFESVSHEGKDVAIHADIDDESQTVYSPKLKTTATDKADGDKVTANTGTVTISDKVCYTGLKPGQSYDITGTLMDKATGKELLVNGKPVTSTISHIAEKSEDCATVEFTVDGAALAGKTTVVFESMSTEGKQIAVHADIDDEGQTVTTPNSGDGNGGGKGQAAQTGFSPFSVIGGLTLVGAGLTALFASRRQQRNA